MNQHDCRFCSIMEGSEDLFATNPFVKKGLEIPYEASDLVIIPDAAPLAYEHCLIVPRHHVLSIATLDRNKQKEILNLAEELVNYLRIFRKAPLKPYYFEHGSTSEDEKIGCSTVHAHFHIFFAPPNLGNGVGLDGFQKFGNIENGWETLGGNAYYLLGEFGKTAWGCDVNEDPRLKCTMFIRKVFSFRLNRPELADYRRYSEPLAETDELVESVYETYKHLKEFSRCKQQMLEVIRNH